MTSEPSSVTTKPSTELPIEPFLLEPRNIDFLQSRTRYIADLRFDWSLDSLMTTIVALIALPVVLSMCIGAAPSQLPVNAIVFLFVSGICIIVAQWGWNIRYFLRLSREGQIIQGELTKINLKSTKDGYSVAAWYSFVSPSGNKIEGKNSTTRSDLIPPSRKISPRRERWGEKHPPEPGTPIAVIYVDDKHYKML